VPGQLLVCRLHKRSPQSSSISKCSVVATQAICIYLTSLHLGSSLPKATSKLFATSLAVATVTAVAGHCQQLIHVQVDGAALLSEVEHVPHTRPSSRHEASSSSEPQVAYTHCLSLHHTVLQLLLPHDMGAPLLPFEPYTACSFGRLGLCTKHHTLQFWDIETSHKAPLSFDATCAIAAAVITYLHCKVSSSQQSALNVAAA